MKTYFLASSIQNIIQNKQHFMNNEEEIELKVFAKDTDYDEKCNAIAVESFTGQSWIITESFKEACEAFRQDINRYATIENIVFEEIEQGTYEYEEISEKLF